MGAELTAELTRRMAPELRHRYSNKVTKLTQKASTSQGNTYGGHSKQWGNTPENPVCQPRDKPKISGNSCPSSIRLDTSEQREEREQRERLRVGLAGNGLITVSGAAIQTEPERWDPPPGRARGTLHGARRCPARLRSQGKCWLENHKVDHWTISKGHLELVQLTDL
ncbi:Hypothetical predicted protein [Pelobates cultripes]|uniref:Uncharacterized protein n=1 Tax=Pelobates cultripes TaxID=61616 RepID=A0AAD1SES6_PELCU|nr:Hypothetical predicted protein [Pelobates cultripes]